jgi:hypothetical protein
MYIFRGQGWLLDNKRPFQMEVVEGNWGTVKIEHVRRLLEGVVEIFLGCFDTSFSVSICVESRPHHITPEVYCGNAFTGDYVVSLAAQDYRLVPYQFAHELCHVLSDCTNLHLLPNKWFHESLCELASIFVLKQMAKGCCEPSPFLDALREYVDVLLTYPDFQLPNNLTLPNWFKANEQSLRADPYQRGKNGIVALQLLPLVENNSKFWQNICFIPDSAGSFEEFLDEWQKQCPKPQKLFVAEIIKLFGFNCYACSDPVKI